MTRRSRLIAAVLTATAPVATAAFAAPSDPTTYCADLLARLRQAETPSPFVRMAKND